MMQKSWKMTETLAHWHSSESTQWELSNEYQRNRVKMVFKNLCILVVWTKVASALEGLNGWNIWYYMPLKAQCTLIVLQYMMQLILKQESGISIDLKVFPQGSKISRVTGRSCRASHNQNLIVQPNASNAWGPFEYRILFVPSLLEPL